MKFQFFSTLALLCLSISVWGQKQEELTPVPNQYIVILKSTVAQPAIVTKTPTEDRESSFANGAKARQDNEAVIQRILDTERISTKSVSATYADVVVGFAATLTADEVARLTKNADIEGVYNDFYINLDPLREETTPSEVNGQSQTTTCAINNAGGFQNGAGKFTWIWILDTGIDLDHPDLNVLTSSSIAKSFVPGQSADDGNGHGTHCAGIAAAKNNSFGVVGVSAGAPVVPVKVLSNSGSGQWSYLLSGLNHVAAWDIPNDVVNMSLGGWGGNNCANSNPSIRNAILNLGNAGVWVCIAAGNSNCNAAQAFPACINGNRVLTVGSMTCGQTCSSFSNFSSSVVDWVATGSNVYSTFKNGGYTTLSGTSMAAPVVAGICHARAAAPVSGGNISCGNGCVSSFSYRKARRI